MQQLLQVKFQDSGLEKKNNKLTNAMQLINIAILLFAHINEVN